MVAASYDDVTPLTVGSSTCWHNLTMILTPSPKLRRVEAANDPAATLTECLNCARRGAPRCQNRSLLCLARPLPEPAQRDQCAFKVEIAVRVGIPIQAYVTSLDSRPAMTIAADLEKSLESHGCFTPSNRTWTAAARLPRRPTRGATSAICRSPGCWRRKAFSPRAGAATQRPGARRGSRALHSCALRSIKLEHGQLAWAANSEAALTTSSNLPSPASRPLRISGQVRSRSVTGRPWLGATRRTPSRCICHSMRST